MAESDGEPRGRLELRMVAMPGDTNPAGDIFGGWIMSLMDLAAGISARAVAKGRVATAAVSNLVVPAAGEGGGRGLLLRGGAADGAELDHAGGGGVGAARRGRRSGSR